MILSAVDCSLVSSMIVQLNCKKNLLESFILANGASSMFLTRSGPWSLVLMYRIRVMTWYWVNPLQVGWRSFNSSTTFDQICIGFKWRFSMANSSALFFMKEEKSIPSRLASSFLETWSCCSAWRLFLFLREHSTSWEPTSFITFPKKSTLIFDEHLLFEDLQKAHQ